MHNFRIAEFQNFTTGGALRRLVVIDEILKFRKSEIRLSPMLLALVLTTTAAVAPTPMDLGQAEKLASLALACVHQEYPNKIAHTLATDADAKVPRELTPIFYGAFDWHSAVHGHWTLVRLVRLFPGEPWAAAVHAALDASFDPARAAGELAYLAPRPGFEMPYGVAWLST